MGYSLVNPHSVLEPTVQTMQNAKTLLIRLKCGCEAELVMYPKNVDPGQWPIYFHRSLSCCRDHEMVEAFLKEIKVLIRK